MRNSTCCRCWLGLSNIKMVSDRPKLKMHTGGTSLGTDDVRTMTHARSSDDRVSYSPNNKMEATVPYCGNRQNDSMPPEYQMSPSCRTPQLYDPKLSIPGSRVKPDKLKVVKAVEKGHLEVVRDRWAHDIHCTSWGADRAAMSGHLEVIRDLRAHGIHCTPNSADGAAGNGHLDVVQDLRAHGIHCTSTGADWAAENGHLHRSRPPSLCDLLRTTRSRQALNGCS